MSPMPELTSLTVEDHHAGQRLDNFLLRQLHRPPRGLLYRLLRQGLIRLNQRKASADARVETGDRISYPAHLDSPSPVPLVHRLPPLEVLFEDDELLVINKAAGQAVHGGSGISIGLIELARQARPECRFLELAHRLDRDTSGILLLAKKRRSLLALHEQLREHSMRKHYTVLVGGQWQRPDGWRAEQALSKNWHSSGGQKVRVDAEGKASVTCIHTIERWGEFSLLDCQILTGRTHQIRVHLSDLGYPVAGDERYGEDSLNQRLRRMGFKRMFLHAARLELSHPSQAHSLQLTAPLPPVCVRLLQQLRTKPAPLAQERR